METEKMEIAKAIELAVINIEFLINAFADEHGAEMTDEALENYYKSRAPLESARRLVTDARKAI